MSAAPPPPTAPRVQPTSAAVRSRAEAAGEALPDVLAAAGCALAWYAPRAPGFDLVTVFGSFFAIEIAVAVVLSMAGAARIADREMSKPLKLELIVLPALMLSIFAFLYVGFGALLAILWLGGRSAWRVLREERDSRPAVSGLWIVYSRSGFGHGMELTTTRPTGEPAAGTWVVAAGQEQKMAGITIGLWMLTFWVVAFIGDLPQLGATVAYADAIGWERSPYGELVPAHVALAAGTLLFAARTLAHFHGSGHRR